MNGGAAQAWFVGGAIVAMVAGSGHAALALFDTARPTYFAPIERAVEREMEGTGLRLARMFGRSGARPSLWRVWLGINIGIGVGILSFGLLCLLIAAHDFGLVERIAAIRALAIAFSAAYLVLSLRFWFYLPALFAATATTCFTVAAVLCA